MMAGWRRCHRCEERIDTEALPLHSADPRDVRIAQLESVIRVRVLACEVCRGSGCAICKLLRGVLGGPAPPFLGAGSVRAVVRRAVAWAGGYCSAACDEAAVLTAVAAGRAWWQLADGGASQTFQSAGLAGT